MPGFTPVEPMAKRKPSQRQSAGNKPHIFVTVVALVFGLSLHSCADIPAEREVLAASAAVKALIQQLATARADGGVDSFSACRQFFAAGKPPVVSPRPMQRALCYDAFAILHSGESKTAVYVAQRLNRALVADADEKRTDKFFADARLRAAERATLEDYRGSGFDRGHLAPAGQMPTAQAMAQSFSLANIVPQAPRHNQGAWRVAVEDATKKYAARASGDVYVITGPVYVPSIAQSDSIGPGKVRVPTYLFKLVYDEGQNRAWAHWHLNDNATRASRPISYDELVRRVPARYAPD